LFDILFF